MISPRDIKLVNSLLTITQLLRSSSPTLPMQVSSFLKLTYMLDTNHYQRLPQVPTETNIPELILPQLNTKSLLTEAQFTSLPTPYHVVINQRDDLLI